jgi:hypothetical protein
MAQQTTVRFIDDLDGSDASGTFDFSLDGPRPMTEDSEHRQTDAEPGLQHAPFQATPRA